MQRALGSNCWFPSQSVKVLMFVLCPSGHMCLAFYLAPELSKHVLGELLSFFNTNLNCHFLYGVCFGGGSLPRSPVPFLSFPNRWVLLPNSKVLLDRICYSFPLALIISLHIPLKHYSIITGLLKNNRQIKNELLEAKNYVTHF